MVTTWINEAAVGKTCGVNMSNMMSTLQMRMAEVTIEAMNID
jgi:hypothetical protein